MPRKKKDDPMREPTAVELRKQRFEAIRSGYGEADDIVSLLFQTAVNLEDEKRDVLARTAANRRSLRDLAAQGLASRDDVDAIYPPKADGGEDSSDTTATAAAVA